MILLEDVKRIAEKATGWRRPEDPQALLRERKPQTYRFKDDGLIPNHPKWPLIIYESAVRLPESLDPAAVFEELFDSSQPARWQHHGSHCLPQVPVSPIWAFNTVARPLAARAAAGDA